MFNAQLNKIAEAHMEGVQRQIFLCFLEALALRKGLAGQAADMKKNF